MKQVILCLLAIVAVGYALNTLLPQYIISKTGPNATSCLAMLGSTTREEDGRTYIIGTIRNNCDHKFSDVTVSFKVDREPGPLENLPEAVAYAYSRDVVQGETREFKTVMPVSKNATYRFDQINAY